MLDEKTIKNYRARINKIKEDNGNLNILNYPTLLLSYLSNKYNNVGTQKTYISAVLNYVISNEYNKDVINDYHKLLLGLRKAETIETDKNKLTDKERIKYLDWADISGLVDKIEDVRKRAIMALYILIPPRRIIDFSYMKLIKTYIKKYKLNLDDNYIVFNKQGGQMIFNNYKTNETYGQQIFNIPPKLKLILLGYIEEYNIDYNKYLLTGTNEPMTQPQLTKEITNITKEYTGKPINLNILRHSYINSIPTNITLGERREISEKMAHSIMTQLTYIKN